MIWQVYQSIACIAYPNKCYCTNTDQNEMILLSLFASGAVGRTRNWDIAFCLFRIFSFRSWAVPPACRFKSLAPPWQIEKMRRQVVQFALYTLPLTGSTHSNSSSHWDLYFWSRLAFFLFGVEAEVCRAGSELSVSQTLLSLLVVSMVRNWHVNRQGGNNAMIS